MAVQPVHIFSRIAHAKARVQVQEQVNVSKRLCKIQKNHAFLSEGGELHSQVDCYRGGSYSAFGTHHHNQLIQGRPFLHVQVQRESSEDLGQRVQIHWLR